MNNKNIIILMLAMSLSIGGCSYLPSWMGGTKTEKAKLPGERIAVLPVEDSLKPDEAIKNLQVTLPTPQANAEWPQHSGMFTAATGNLAAKNLDVITSATAGNGEAFNHTLLTPPVVGGGMVFAMDAVGNISAHDAANIATIKWKSKGVSEKHTPEIIGGGLAYAQGKLYAVSGRGIVAAFDAASGKEIWKKPVGMPFRSAPTLGSGKLFATTIDNQVFAFDLISGNVAWNERGIDETTDLMNAVSPAVANDTVIVPFSSGELYALAAPDGRGLWNDTLPHATSLDASGVFTGVGGDPIIDGDVVFAIGSGGGLSVMSLSQGQPVWSRPIASINTPWLVGDYLYVLTTDNNLICFVKYTGAIRWTTKLPTYQDEVKKKNPITWRGPVMVNGMLLVVGSRGQMLVVAGTDGTIIESRPIAEDIYTAPVVANGHMYLMGQDATLYSLQ